MDEGAFKIIIDDNDFRYIDYVNNRKKRVVNVGDIITMNVAVFKNVDGELRSDFENEIQIDFQVVGIYSSRKLKPGNTMKSYSGNFEPIEIPQKALEQVLKIVNERMEEYTDEELDFFNQNNYGYYKPNIEIACIEILSQGYGSSQVYRKDLLDNYKFINDYYALKASEEEYQYMQAPLENLEALANVTLIASAILCVVLLSLVANIFIRNRTKEIGVYMSLGATKKNLIVQFVGEILLVGLLATSCAMISGNKLGNELSQKFMQIQIDMDTEAKYQEDNPDELTQLDLLEVYHIEFNAEYIINIYIVSTFVLLISSILPIMTVLKTQPKKVLL